MKEVRKILRKEETIRRNEKKRIERIDQYEKRKKAQFEQNVEKFSRWYEIYKELGFKKFKEETQYEYTLENLVSQFSKYVENFVPQSRIKRGE